jgi:hypothetical protein
MGLEISKDIKYVIKEMAKKTGAKEEAIKISINGRYLDEADYSRTLYSYRITNNSEVVKFIVLTYKNIVFT